MNKDHNFSSKLGQIVADVFVGCLAACVTAVAIALTVRFIVWLF